MRLAGGLSVVGQGQVYSIGQSPDQFGPAALARCTAYESGAQSHFAEDKSRVELMLCCTDQDEAMLGSLSSV